MKTLGFLLSIEMVELYYERCIAIEKALGRTMDKVERQALLIEMYQRGECEAFKSDDCPELVERKIMKHHKVGFLRDTSKNLDDKQEDFR